jgi:hypothetical protein
VDGYKKGSAKKRLMNCAKDDNNMPKKEVIME